MAKLPDPDYKEPQLEAWKEFQQALCEARKKLGALSYKSAGGVDERCWAGLAAADLWSR